ncbi:MAG: MaoC family dehydratase N-terminal domain-containing protein [SAR324 cluster bacterium]|nr:MaoC family dehydratase N-terminal domain-containing protein [SAR324 cluster bacterium]
MDYKNYINKTYEPFTIEVEKGRLRFFAQAIGEQNPIYQEESTAQEAGYESIPAPLTFPFSITMDAGQSFNVLEDMGIPKTKAVHGEQGFIYHKPICADDVVTGQQKIVDIYEKKGGALLFIVTEISLSNQRNEPVCDLQSTIVVRNG